MIGPARQRAAELDAEFSSTKKLRGPLHGVPVRFFFFQSRCYELTCAGIVDQPERPV